MCSIGVEDMGVRGELLNIIERCVAQDVARVKSEASIILEDPNTPYQVKIQVHKMFLPFSKEL